jgi:putative transposase
MEVSDAKRLKALEAQNAKLKKQLAESMLEIDLSGEEMRKNGNRTGEA